MNETQIYPLEAILRYCAAAAPHPWYPSEHARKNGIDRNSLDPHIDRLRMGGLIRLTDWVQGFGQGYALTPAGRVLLGNPRELADLRDGKLPMPKNGPSTARAPRHSRMTTWERGEEVRDAAFSESRPVLTVAILIVNVAVFAVGMRWGQANHWNQSEILHQTGAVTPIDLVQGEWLRLITACFVHADPVHLSLNMLSLYLLGRVAERLWGRLRFLALYLVAGWGSTCIAMAWQPVVVENGVTKLVQLAGASGAICGLLASLGAWLILNRHHLDRGWVAARLQTLFINFLLIAFMGYSIPGISNVAHFGGALVGAIVSPFLNYQRFTRTWPRWLGLAATFVLSLVCLGILRYAMTSSGDWFQAAYLPLSRRAESSADKAMTKAARILVTDPRERNGEAVRDATAALREARERLLGWTVRFWKLGPYRDPDHEKARHIRQRHLEKLAQVLALTEERLQRGADWTDAEQAALDEQLGRERQARREWRELLE